MAVVAKTVEFDVDLGNNIKVEFTQGNWKLCTYRKYAGEEVFRFRTRDLELYRDLYNQVEVLHKDPGPLVQVLRIVTNKKDEDDDNFKDEELEVFHKAAMEIILANMV